METPSEHTGSHAIDQLQEMQFRTAVRMYLERLAFTTRGNFAFVAGILFWISYNSQQPPLESSVSVPTGLPVAPETISAVLEFAGGVVTILNGVLVGACVLILLDLYEHEVGLTVEAEN